MGEFRGSFPQEAERALQNGVTAEVWRRALGYGEAASAPGPMDVVWLHPFRLMMTSGKSLLESIKALEVVVAIKRPERGKTRDPKGKHDKILGQASWNLANLVSRDDYCEEVCLKVPLLQSGSAKTDAFVKLRLQVRPLEPAPDLKGEIEEQGLIKVRPLKSLAQLGGQAREGLKKLRQSINFRSLRRGDTQWVSGGDSENEAEEMADTRTASSANVLSRVSGWWNRRSIAPTDAVDSHLSTIREGSCSSLPSAAGGGSREDLGENAGGENADGNFLVKWWRNRRTAAAAAAAQVEADGAEGLGAAPKSAMHSAGRAGEGDAKHVHMREPLVSKSSTGTEADERAGGKIDSMSLSEAVRRDLQMAEATSSKQKESLSPTLETGGWSSPVAGLLTQSAQPGVLAVRAAARRL